MQRDPGLNAGYPEGIPNRLRVSQADGKVCEQEVRYPPGHARNPMSDEEVEQKFLRAGAGSPLQGRQRAALDLLWTIDTATSMAPLFSLLAVDDAEERHSAG